MNEKHWVSSDMDSCPECGNDIEIYTACKVDNHFFDGDDARCIDKCGPVGSFSAYEFTTHNGNSGYINWLGY